MFFYPVGAGVELIEVGWRPLFAELTGSHLFCASRKAFEVPFRQSWERMVGWPEEAASS